MARKLAADIDEFVQRAQSDVDERDRRFVYGESSPGYAIRPNKKVVGRRVSTFYLIVVLFGAGIAIVVYINNIIVVNRLSAEIDQQQLQYDKIVNANAVLKAEINRKSGWERIGKVANEQVGLRYPSEQPTMFDVDNELIERAESVSASQ